MSIPVTPRRYPGRREGPRGLQQAQRPRDPESWACRESLAAHSTRDARRAAWVLRAVGDTGTRTSKIILNRRLAHMTTRGSGGFPVLALTPHARTWFPLTRCLNMPRTRHGHAASWQQPRIRLRHSKRQILSFPQWRRPGSGPRSSPFPSGQQFAGPRGSSKVVCVCLPAATLQLFRSQTWKNEGDRQDRERAIGGGETHIVWADAASFWDRQPARSWAVSHRTCSECGWRG